MDSFLYFGHLRVDKLLFTSHYVQPSIGIVALIFGIETEH